MIVTNVSAVAGLTLSTATGRSRALTSTITDVRFEAPSSSAAVSVIVYVPSDVYAWVAVGPGDVSPSPQAMR